jgi:beta-N-acetylhexosaminidase
MGARELVRRLGGMVALLSVGALALGATPTDAAVAAAPALPAVSGGVPMADDVAVGVSPLQVAWFAPAAAVVATPPPPAAVPATVANPRTSWGPSLETVEAARAAVAAMSLEQLAGQVLVARYWETDPAAAGQLVTRWNLGGVILMDENIVSREQVAATAAAVQAAVLAGGRSWPGIVAVDQEGGRVERLRGLVAALPAFAAFGGAGPDATRSAFGGLGTELRALGITMDMAPVADVTIGPDDPTIGDRSASTDPQVVSVIALAAGHGLLDAGVIPVLKHFPGHGSVTVDSHVALPVQPAPLAVLEARDLVPFRSGVAAGLPVVMVGHLDMTQLDPGVSASLSAATYRLLRDDLGFEGVAVTDSLAMGAVPRPAPGQEAVAALVAGADLVLMPWDVGTAHPAIVAAVQDGRLSMERLTEAAVRVVALQMWSAAG